MTASLADVARLAGLARKVADELDGIVQQRQEREALVARFRTASGARLVAELLLDSGGEWVSKFTLAKVAGVTQSVVPRVVKTLQESGVLVERDVINGSAVYRVVGHG